jgi:hypothetical protein
MDGNVRGVVSCKSWICNLSGNPMTVWFREGQQSKVQFTAILLHYA